MQLFPQINYIKCVNGAETYRMSYMAWGRQVSGGKTLICIHGLNRNCRDFDFVARHFVKLGYYVIVPDIVGRGNSDYLKNWVGYNIPAYVIDILFMIKTLGLENIEFIGTSMGGLIGMSIAALPVHPIKKLVLNDIGAEIEIKGLERIAAYSETTLDFATIEEARQNLMEVSKEFGIPPELEDFYTLTSFQKNEKGRYQLKRDANINLSSKMAMVNNKNIEIWEFWKKINIDVLVIHGAQSDLLTSTTIQQMKEINPKTRSVTIENAGHAPYLYSEQHMSYLQGFLEERI